MTPNDRMGLALKLLGHLPLLKRLLLVVEAVFPLTMMALGLLGAVSPDLAIASISATFALALVPGIVQCYMGKLGWSKQSCTMTGVGLFSMSVLFYYTAFVYGAPLFLTATTTMMSSAMWLVLLAQAFKYGKAAPAESPLDHVTKVGDTIPADVLKNALSPENMAQLQEMAQTLFGGGRMFGNDKSGDEEEE